MPISNRARAAKRQSTDALRPGLREILSAYRTLGSPERAYLLKLAERMATGREDPPEDS